MRARRPVHRRSVSTGRPHARPMWRPVPTVPSGRSTPPETSAPMIAAPIPAGAAPAVEIPAVTASAPDELRVFDRRRQVDGQRQVSRLADQGCMCRCVEDRRRGSDRCRECQQSEWFQQSSLPFLRRVSRPRQNLPHRAWAFKLSGTSRIGAAHLLHATDEDFGGAAGGTSNTPLSHSRISPDFGRFTLCKTRCLCYRRPIAASAVFLGSSAVEHSTVNRMVAGSNPARGANKFNHLSKPPPVPYLRRIGRVHRSCNGPPSSAFGGDSEAEQAV